LKNGAVAVKTVSTEFLLCGKSVHLKVERFVSWRNCFFAKLFILRISGEGGAIVEVLITYNYCLKMIGF
jgi:hypothetical protein